jgi:mono/diheme cytochrome c family protein/plastocyanin
VNRLLGSALLLLILGVPALLLVVYSEGDDVVVLRGRMPEAGGWSPEEVRITVGEEFTFRLTSQDVMHGFAIARSGLEAVDVEPGKWSEVSWTSPEAGEYTFYCTRWCGPNHWRMTGTIVVQDERGVVPTPTLGSPPLYARLGLDLDLRAERPELRGLRTSAARGARLAQGSPGLGLEGAREVTQTPLEAWERLRAAPQSAGLEDGDLWDLVAYLWAQDLDPARLEAGKALYAERCAACHGPTGRGDGVMARYFADPAVADFTDLARMATANRAILQGKVLRGGMGTGMPNWGLLLSEEETWAVTEYLWLLAFAGR